MVGGCIGILQMTIQENQKNWTQRSSTFGLALWGALHNEADRWVRTEGQLQKQPYLTQLCTLRRGPVKSFIMVCGAHIWYPACVDQDIKPGGSESISIMVDGRKLGHDEKHWNLDIVNVNREKCSLLMYVCMYLFRSLNHKKVNVYCVKGCWQIPNQDSCHQSFFCVVDPLCLHLFMSCHCGMFSSESMLTSG